MPSKYLHIISFNIPHPPDYGGVIDVFYKLEALKHAGIQVILHCFEYGRQHPKELEDLCFKVHYYPRKKGLKYFLSKKPYIVATRNSKSLPENLLKDAFPVLFEGLHSTMVLGKCASAHKKIMVRTHNIEHLYYRALSRSEPDFFQKIFLRTEALKLKQYEEVLKGADHILGIARHETAYFNQTYGNATFVPPFHRFDEINALTGTGDYILFHGNLGVPENSASFLKFAAQPLSKVNYQVVVAGKSPSDRFRKKLARYPHVKLIPDPVDEEMDKLIQLAQINLLLTSQATGIKLKLLHSLYTGRHCLVNPKMVEGTGLAQLCTIVRSEEELTRAIDHLMNLPFDESQILERKKALKEYSNRAGAEKIIRIMG